jgi:hypothetical protein
MSNLCILDFYGSFINYGDFFLKLLNKLLELVVFKQNCRLMLAGLNLNLKNIFKRFSVKKCGHEGGSFLSELSLLY